MEDQQQAPVTPTTRAKKHRRRTKLTKGLAFQWSAMGSIMQNLLEYIPKLWEKWLQLGAKWALQQAAEEMLEGRFVPAQSLSACAGAKCLSSSTGRLHNIERSAFDAPMA